MLRLGASAVVVAALAAVAGLSTPAFASTSGGASRAVFVQTDNTAGNQVIAYQRAADGTLTQAGSYPTGGTGGILTGSVVDHQASQGSLGYDPRHGVLFALNAGSSTASRAGPRSRPGCSASSSTGRGLRLTGQVTEQDLTPRMRDDLVELYRQWQAGHE